MIRPIVKDILFLQRKAEQAGRKDAAAGRDLLDTLAAHSEDCVGLAANMIGSTKAIIAVSDNGRLLLMYNPEVTKASLPLTTRKRAVSPSPDAAPAGVMTGLKSAMRMKISIRRKSGSPVLQQKSCSTKWTTLPAYSYKRHALTGRVFDFPFLNFSKHGGDINSIIKGTIR